MFFLSVFVESIGNEGIFISQVTTQKKQENTRSIRLFAESTLLVFLSLSLSVAPVKLHFTLKKKQYNKKVRTLICLNLMPQTLDYDKEINKDI